MIVICAAVRVPVTIERLRFLCGFYLERQRRKERGRDRDGGGGREGGSERDTESTRRRGPTHRPLFETEGEESYETK